MPITERGRELASLRRRAGAAGIDVACILSGSVGVLGAAAVGVRVRKGAAWQGMDDMQESVTWFMETLGWKRAEPVLALTSAVSRRNWRSPGMYLMHIRRQDVRTGGPVTVRSALIRHLVGWGGSRLLFRRVLRPRLQRQQAQAEAIRADVETARREHADDERARQQAVTRVYSAAGASPLGCCWMPFIPAAINVLVLLFSPRHQSPADWLAGIVLVKD